MRPIFCFCFSIFLTVFCSYSVSSQEYSDNQDTASLYTLLSENYLFGLPEDLSPLTPEDTLFTYLDPYSKILSKTEAEKKKNMLLGYTVGLGIQGVKLDTVIYVTDVKPSSQADLAGIVRGDLIIWLNGKFPSQLNPFNDLGSEQADAAGELRMWVFTAGKGSRRVVAQIGKYAVNDITYYGNISTTVGYIKVDRFSQKTYHEFINKLSTLRPSTQALIIDLRGNLGGMLLVASQIVDAFIPYDISISTIDFPKIPPITVKSQMRVDPLNYKLVVLIDRETSSSAEIFAAALKDLNCAKIIGERSYGKGLVLKPFTLADERELWLTVGKARSPSGAVIQKSFENGRGELFLEENSLWGVTPDIACEQSLVDTACVNMLKALAVSRCSDMIALSKAGMTLPISFGFSIEELQQLKKLSADLKISDKQLDASYRYVTIDMIYGRTKVMDVLAEYDESVNQALIYFQKQFDIGLH